MTRRMPRLAGPELFWLSVYALAWLVASANSPATAAGNAWLERLTTWLLPLVAVVGAFWFVFGPRPGTGSRRFAWVRLVIATLIGLNACLFALIDAIDYGDSRNAGVLGFWMYGVMVGMVVFLAMSVALRFGLWRR